MTFVIPAKAGIQRLPKRIARMLKSAHNRACQKLVRFRYETALLQLVFRGSHTNSPFFEVYFQLRFVWVVDAISPNFLTQRTFTHVSKSCLILKYVLAILRTSRKK